MRFLGAFCISLAGLLGGLRAAQRQRETLRRCVVLCQMLELMTFELTRFRTPLPELFSGLASQLGEPAAGLCAAVADLLGSGAPFSEAWTKSLAAVSAMEGEELAPLAVILGRYGAEEQAEAVDVCRRALESRGASIRAQLRERSRVYVGVGAAGGVILAVMLL